MKLTFDDIIFAELDDPSAARGLKLAATQAHPLTLRRPIVRPSIHVVYADGRWKRQSCVQAEVELKMTEYGLIVLP